MNNTQNNIVAENFSKSQETENTAKTSPQSKDLGEFFQEFFEKIRKEKKFIDFRHNFVFELNLDLNGNVVQESNNKVTIRIPS